MRRETEVEEPSDESLVDSEHAQLLRKYRVLNNDYRAYKEHTKRIINKQNALVESLAQEKLEIDTCLSKMETTQNKGKDQDNTETLQDLSKSETDLIEAMKEERLSIKKVDVQIIEMEKRIAEQRKVMGGTHNSTSRFIAMQKKRSGLENRLDKANVHFNKQLATNGKLRSDIDHLRSERAVFDNLYKKLSRRLEQTKREMSDVVEACTVAFEQRDEAQSKMTALMERNEKEQQQHDNEMKELQRRISHDKKIKEFMSIKASDRAEVKAEEAAKRNKGDGNKTANADQQAIQVYEEAIARIKKVTSKEDLTAIIEDFIKIEDENFALFNYVNELNTEVELTEDQVESANADIDKFQREDKQIAKLHTNLMRRLENQYDKVTSEAESAEKRLREVNKALDELCAGVEHMFRQIGCDPRPIQEMLGGDSGITNKNVNVYVGIIEQRTSELLSVLHYINNKKSELEGAPPPQPAVLTTVPVSTVTIIPPSGDADEELEDGFDEDYHPLTEEELRMRVLNIIDKKDFSFPSALPTTTLPKVGPASKSKKKKVPTATLR